MSQGKGLKAFLVKIDHEYTKDNERIEKIERRGVLLALSMKQAAECLGRKISVTWGGNSGCTLKSERGEPSVHIEKLAIIDSQEALNEEIVCVKDGHGIYVERIEGWTRGKIC